MATFLALCCSKLILMICYHNYIQHSQFLKFADNVKCFLHISTQSDHSALQEDITALFTWSKDSYLDSLKKLLIYHLNVSWIPDILYLT